MRDAVADGMRGFWPRSGHPDVPPKASMPKLKLHAIVVEKEQNTQIEIAPNGPVEC